MPDEIKDEEVIEEENKEQDDTKGEVEEETDKTEESQADDSKDEFDENLIDPEVKEYKPAEVKPSEEDDVDEEDKARIEKIIEKKYGGDIDTIKKKVELDSFFGANPEFSKYRKAVEIYKAHPTYSGIPVHNLAAMVAAKDMQKIGAAKERQVQRDVAETRSPGGQTRKPDGESTNWLKMSKDEFEAKKAEVLGRSGV